MLLACFQSCPLGALADAFAGLSTEAPGKRKVDGSLAATRLGSTATERWANERFRQTMLLVREFRMEWPNMSLLTSDDVESIRWLLDCALLASPYAKFTLLWHFLPFASCYRDTTCPLPPTL